MNDNLKMLTIAALIFVIVKVLLWFSLPKNQERLSDALHKVSFHAQTLSAKLALPFNVVGFALVLWNAWQTYLQVGLVASTWLPVVIMGVALALTYLGLKGEKNA